MSWQRGRTVLVGIILVMTLGVAGCGPSKEFTPEEFGTITKDMTEAKVIEILGKPKEAMVAFGERRLFWVTKEKYYSITFADGKVVEPMVHFSKDDYDLILGLMKTAKGK